jgi:hypothetical protein
MGVIVENLKMEKCKISVDVSDTKNKGVKATVTAEIEGYHETLKKENVELFAKRGKIVFDDTPTDLGGVRNVTVTLKAEDGRSDDQTKPVHFCSE